MGTSEVLTTQTYDVLGIGVVCTIANDTLSLYFDVLGIEGYSPYFYGGPTPLQVTTTTQVLGLTASSLAAQASLRRTASLGVTVVRPSMTAFLALVDRQRRALLYPAAPKSKDLETMSITKRPLIALLTGFIAAVTVAACGGGGGSAPGTLPAVHASGAAGATAAPAMTSVPYASASLSTATYVGPAQFGAMSIDVVPTLQNAAGLSAYAQAASDPGSPLFRQFLTPQQIGSRFGASDADYAAQVAYFRAHGLVVAGWPQRLLLHVGGTQSQLESALGAKFGIYRSGSSTFIALTGNAQLPQALRVQQLVHANESAEALTLHANYPPLVAGGAYLSPQQLAHAFQYDTAWAAGFTGSGINVGIIASAGIDPNDVPAYGAMFGAKVATVTQVNAQDSYVFASPLPSVCPSNNPYSFVCNYSLGLTSPPPVTPACNQNKVSLPACNPEDGEAQLDTETIASLAYNANVLFYLAYNPTECYSSGQYAPSSPCPSGGTPAPEIGNSLWFDEIQQAISDDRADVISISLGGCEPQEVNAVFDEGGNGYGPTAWAAVKAEGTAVFVAAGDGGVDDCGNGKSATVDWPGTDPSNTDVGAVFAPLDQGGNIVGQVTAWGFPNSFGMFPARTRPDPAAGSPSTSIYRRTNSGPMSPARCATFPTWPTMGPPARRSRSCSMRGWRAARVLVRRRHEPGRADGLRDVVARAASLQTDALVRDRRRPKSVAPGRRQAYLYAIYNGATAAASPRAPVKRMARCSTTCKSATTRPTDRRATCRATTPAQATISSRASASPTPAR